MTSIVIIRLNLLTLEIIGKTSCGFPSPMMLLISVFTEVLNDQICIIRSM